MVGTNISRFMVGAAGTLGLAVLALPLAPAAANAAFFFSNGNVNGLMASASRPDTGGAFEIESADDFLLGSATRITGATFTGLLVPNAGGGTPNVNSIVVEIYRVFPSDSDVGRTSGPPTFSTSQVPTRVNSPSDVAFDTRDSTTPTLTFTTATLAATFTANNTGQAGGIHPSPNQKTGGNGPVTGAEVAFDVTFTTPIDLPPDHYFFVPQVDVAGGSFLWLSSTRPIVAPGTPFLPDLQSWTRDAALDPDWLRIGTDIVGAPAAGGAAPTFNAAFTLSGDPIPEPASMLLLGVGLIGLTLLRWGSRVRRHH